MKTFFQKLGREKKSKDVKDNRISISYLHYLQNLAKEKLAQYYFIEKYGRKILKEVIIYHAGMIKDGIVQPLQ